MKNSKSPAKDKRSQPRPRVKPVWRTRKGLAAVGAFAFLVVATGGWWLWQDGWVGRATQQARWGIIAATADMGFRVEDVLVVGRSETPRKKLLEAVRLARGAPILAFDPHAAKARIEALPWVRSASVQRRLPNTVFLRIVERRPLAIWQHEGQFSLIDFDGTVIAENDKELERFSDLLLVVGDDAPSHAARLLEMLWHQPELMARVKAAVRVGGRRWNVRLDNGIDVRLPEENPASAWARLADYEKRHHVLAKDVGVLDLRLPDRLIVQKIGTGDDAELGTET